MADIFFTKDAANLLRGRKLVFIGDSNIRALYKDLVVLLQENRLIREKELKAKAERTFMGDVLLRGHPLTKGRSYVEDRVFRTDNFFVEFHFVTKCLNEDVEHFLNEVRTKRTRVPDILVMNSTHWDVHRWGFNGVEQFKDNMNRLMHLFRKTFPSSTLVIWVTTPPIAVEVKGGFIIQQIDFAKFSLRFHVMEANMFAQQLVSQFGYNVLDFHFHLKMQVHQKSDGLHWQEKAMRHLTNLLLTHIALAFNAPLPGNFSSSLLEKHKAIARDDGSDFAADVSLPDVPDALMPAPLARAPAGRSQDAGLNSRWQGGQGGGRGYSRGRANQTRWMPPTATMGPPPVLPGPPQSYAASVPTFLPPLPPPPAYPPPALPPLPAYPPPAQPPSPRNPRPERNYADDNVDDVPFFECPTEPQQIPALWGPVRRARHGGYRRTPY